MKRKQRQRQISLLTNTTLKLLNPEYLKITFTCRRETLDFLGTPANMSLKYKQGKKHYLLFKLGNIRINSIDELVKITMNQTENLDKNIKFDKLYLYFSIEETD